MMARAPKNSHKLDRGSLSLYLRSPRSYVRFRRDPLWSRLLWICLFLVSRRWVKTLIFTLVLILLGWHLYSIGARTREVTPNVYEPPKVCADHTRREAEHRSNVWKATCAGRTPHTTDNSDIRNLFFADKRRRFAFCSVPGFTDIFWKRIIRKVNNSSRRFHGTALDIPRWQTYFLAPIAMEETADTTISFIFTEDPYTRLWRTWVEKFYLMGFWFKNVLDTTGSDHRQTCQPNITFAQFLSHVTRKSSFDHPDKMNVHWRPQLRLCDLCWMQPTFVGKAETFEEDAMCILHMTNYTSVLDSDGGKTDHKNKTYSMAVLKYHQTSLRHMRALVLENFSRWMASFPAKACISLQELRRRIWTAFQYLGYITEGATFPKLHPRPKDINSLKQKEVNIENFLSECLHASVAWPGANAKTRQERRQWEFRQTIVRAYSAVSDGVMNRLQMLYESDFRSFGYERQPKDMFESRYQVFN